MDNKQMEAARRSLSVWLGGEDRLGAQPAETEYADEFELDGLRYYIFKFRRDIKDEWLIGICGGYEAGSIRNCGHIFSGMDPYVERTAHENGVMMAEFIRDVHRRENSEEKRRRERMNRLFSSNCEYVSRKTLDVESVMRQFVSSESRLHVTAGTVDVPSGGIVAADPLCYLAMGVCCPVLKERVPAGSYPAEVALIKHRDVGVRICTARLKIKPTPAVLYSLAETEENSSAKLAGWVASGFPVETGIMSFCDAEGAGEFKRYTDRWNADNPDKNLFDDHFAAYFAESAERFPDHQNENGDFTEWKNPVGGKRMVMISSGLGDGFYQCYWGFDEFGDICELTVPMIDPDLFE